MSPASRHLVLVGPMAGGKTTLGRILARRLGRPFIDSDEQISKQAGVSGGDVAAMHGVAALHDLESQALIDALSEDEPTVIAAAASVADSPDAVAALSRADADVVLVEASARALSDRLSDPRHRRVITAGELAVLTRERRRVLIGLDPLVVVDTSAHDPEESAERVLRVLEEAADDE